MQSGIDLSIGGCYCISINDEANAVHQNVILADVLLGSLHKGDGKPDAITYYIICYFVMTADQYNTFKMVTQALQL